MRIRQLEILQIVYQSFISESETEAEDVKDTSLSALQTTVIFDMSSFPIQMDFFGN